MAKGDPIPLTALYQCGEACNVQAKEKSPAGAAFDTSFRPLNFYDLFCASLFAGYEPRNGEGNYPPCTDFEHCGVKNSRKTVCFLQPARIVFGEAYTQTLNNRWAIC